MKPHRSRKAPVPQDGGGHMPLNSAAARGCACPLTPPAKGSCAGEKPALPGPCSHHGCTVRGSCPPLRWSRRTAERQIVTLLITHAVPALPRCLKRIHHARRCLHRGVLIPSSRSRRGRASPDTLFAKQKTQKSAVPDRTTFCVLQQNRYSFCRGCNAAPRAILSFSQDSADRRCGF